MAQGRGWHCAEIESQRSSSLHSRVVPAPEGRLESLMALYVLVLERDM